MFVLSFLRVARASVGGDILLALVCGPLLLVLAELMMTIAEGEAYLAGCNLLYSCSEAEIARVEGGLEELQTRADAVRARLAMNGCPVTYAPSGTGS